MQGVVVLILLTFFRGHGTGGTKFYVYNLRHFQFESRDLLESIIQFLKDNGLQRSALVLHEEGDVSLESIDIERVSGHIMSGKWEDVLNDLHCTNLPRSIMMDVYEQLFLEVLEKADRSTCQKLLNEASAFQYMRSLDPISNVRYKRLESLLSTSGAGQDVYQSKSRNERRRAIVENLRNNLPNSRRSRLLDLVRHGLLWEQEKGLIPKNAVGVNLLTGEIRRYEGIEMKVSVVKDTIKYPKGSFPEALTFSTDGNYIVSGSSDGLIEFYSVETMKLALDLDFQNREQFMFHDSSITAIAFSHDGNILVSGDKDGELRFWDFPEGKLIKQLRGCHRDSITSLEFSADDALIVSASLDKSANVWSVKSGKLIEQYQDHQAFVSDASFLGETAIVTSCSDGYIRIFDRSAKSVLSKFATTSGLSAVKRTIVLKSTDNSERLLVCPHSETAVLCGIDGLVTRSFNSGRQGTDDFVTAIKSPMEAYVYLGSEHGNIYVFDRTKAEVCQVVNVAKADITSMAHHPRKCMLAVASADGSIYVLGR